VIKWTSERVQHLWSLWPRYYTLSEDEKVAIIRAYLTKVLGVSEQDTDAFSKGDGGASHTVGMNQSHIVCEDTRPFWEEVLRICPDGYTEEDIQVLTQTPDVYAILALLNRMEPVFMETTDLGRRLNANAHAYKRREHES